MSDSFGDITTLPQIERAILATLKEWVPSYLRKMERAEGLEAKALPEVASWRPVDAVTDRWPEEQLPSVLLICTTDVALDTQGDNMVAGLRGQISVVVQSNESEGAREIASLYAQALGLIIMQKPGLDQSVKCTATAWERIGVPELGKPDKAATRWLAVGEATVILAVENFAAPLMGPAEPGSEPGDYPTAAHHKLKLLLEG